MEVLYGLHAVEEALRSPSRRPAAILIARDAGPRLTKLAELARTHGVRVSVESKDQLTRLARSDAHQGAVAQVRERQFLSVEDLLAAPPRLSHHFLLALDGVEDPHNLGALLRSADGAGVDGVLLPERRAAPITGSSPRSPPAPANTSPSPALPTSSDPWSSSKNPTSGSSVSTSAAPPITPTSTSAPPPSWSSAAKAPASTTSPNAPATTSSASPCKAASRH